jgi:GTP-binding protein
MINGRRIKLRYAHSGGNNPPIIVIHGNQTAKVPASYQRYLEKVFRRQLDMVGTPIRVEFRSSENPYVGKREEVSQRKVERKNRIKRTAERKKNAKKSPTNENYGKRNRRR